MGSNPIPTVFTRLFGERTLRGAFARQSGEYTVRSFLSISDNLQVENCDVMPEPLRTLGHKTPPHSPYTDWFLRPVQYPDMLAVAHSRPVHVGFRRTTGEG
ncbi:hypothetical protein ACFFQF_14125 [Haladaptatus pallidirubidus]|uniref:Uncharacterized protein n=1 Tax=Haladaptatus pallidirubidus TaxID=1008152 RepID=A0AAV3UCT9_9EURY|nr:hypothetical protein [Haladaptatus pallidirubidus]